MRRLLIVVVFMLLPGCQDMRMSLKHTVSSAVGLDRTITLFAANGDTIRTWSGRLKVESQSGAGAEFIAGGKMVYISGTFIIEEK